jgi:hypothetical protein
MHETRVNSGYPTFEGPVVSGDEVVTACGKAGQRHMVEAMVAVNESHFAIATSGRFTEAELEKLK